MLLYLDGLMHRQHEGTDKPQINSAYRNESFSSSSKVLSWHSLKVLFLPIFLFFFSGNITPYAQTFRANPFSLICFFYPVILLHWNFKTAYVSLGSSAHLQLRPTTRALKSSTNSQHASSDWPCIYQLHVYFDVLLVLNLAFLVHTCYRIHTHHKHTLYLHSLRISRG